jgi:hypothetical protein
VCERQKEKPRKGKPNKKMLVTKSLHGRKKSRPFRSWFVRIFSFGSARFCGLPNVDWKFEVRRSAQLRLAHRIGNPIIPTLSMASQVVQSDNH